MAGAFTILSTINDREIIAALDRLHAKAGRLGPAFKNIGEELLRSTQDRFAAQIDPDGQRWQAISVASIAAKQLRGHSTQILRQRGYLADTIRYQANESGIRIGTNRIYGAIHQFGGKTKPHLIKPRNKKALSWPGGRHPSKSVKHPGSDIPARPFLGASRQDRDRILEVVADHLGVKV